MFRHRHSRRPRPWPVGRWKAIRRAVGPKQPAAPGPIELYDLAVDPSESHNVAADHPEVVARMESILDREHVPDPAWPLPFADANLRPESRDAASERPPRKHPAAEPARR
ncbi:MAG: hypothetical protein ACR2IT_04815 [Pirellulales bacterium]